jgi:hypothetical protein
VRRARRCLGDGCIAPDKGRAAPERPTTHEIVERNHSVDQVALRATEPEVV